MTLGHRVMKPPGIMRSKNANSGCLRHKEPNSSASTQELGPTLGKTVQVSRQVLRDRHQERDVLIQPELVSTSMGHVRLQDNPITKPKWQEAIMDTDQEVTLQGSA